MRLFRFKQSNQAAAVHTSGFADAADKGAPSFGATSPESFQQRLAVDRNRQHIAKFRHAEIHTDYRKRHTKHNAVVNDHHVEHHNEAQTAKPAVPSSPARGTSGYREPTSRGFNPFR